MAEPAVLVRNQRSANRVSAQGRHTDDGEHGTGSDADFTDIADLSNEGGRHADKGAGAEAIEGGEDDDGSVRAGGEPESEDNDAAEVGHYNHDVEAAEAVSEVSGENTACGNR